MTKKLLTLAAAVAIAAPLVAVPVSPAQAQQEAASWLHVRVDEDDGARVRINLPISMVDVALEMAREEGFDEANFRWDEHGDVSIEDLRRIWSELRDAGDAEFVNVRDGEDHVRVFRRGDRVYVHVDEGEAERVRVEMPTEVADALLSGEGEELDVRAAVRTLAEQGEGELVRVRDEDATVRVWMDGKNTQDDEGT